MKVLITGASSGIGRDLAREFAKLNYDIILVARNIERLQELKKELSNKYKTNVVYESVDLTDRKKCIDLYSKYTDIDILINNAGLGDFGNFTNTDINKDLTIIDTNITATHILTKLYLKTMKNRNNGKILNVASIAGFLPGPLMATYYASKNYVVKLSEGIREELKKEKSKVQISILCPGPVHTKFSKVANVKFQIREANSIKVAKYAIQKLEKGKFYIIPGIDIKLAKIGIKLAPTTLVSKVTYRIQKRKLFPKGRSENK